MSKYEYAATPHISVWTKQHSLAYARKRTRLPTEISCISNTEQFKRHLKTFLFKSAFTDH